MEKFITLERAIDILDNNVLNLNTEVISLMESVNRVVKNNIYSPINNPPFNKSAMDGYAIKLSSLENTRYRVIDKIYAGEYYKKELKDLEAIKIMTGAPIPKGANAVIKQEDVVVCKDFIEINKSVKQNDNICFKGEDIKENQLLVSKNKKLNYADIGILASAGISKIEVYKKPKIAIISTGDEVLDITEKLELGKIYNSNKYSIMARVQELGYDISKINHIKDGVLDIAKELKEISKEMDLIITTGGVSVGEKDLLNDSIEESKGTRLFWKIKIKPGSAVLCSKLNNSLIISLSGNPTAALTTFELLVRPTLDKLSGEKRVYIKREKAILYDDINKKSPQRRFVRGNLLTDENGQVVKITQIKSGNGILSSTLNSNCIVEIEAGSIGVKKGEIVNIIKL
ncbi:molybdopterin molybdotransferase MoeA [Clostridium chauvoei]|uniref:Molybdopterin molybdenumtransferase n=2 Tax=Clostridium chauvoei TaxID=46867 RepID=S6EZN2_9CLOT|nr:molybdopterin molybdotransferase MoeA [Clostridium chauvoei]ATD55133.1 molybdopterin molybdenumtransferase MoeA [Clostridium chauvoei]ATD57194.1 molybdopterin molybdenumtransferase MoeA [Clostridium chauvoei]MBX7279478.1 molybdopterin molybdotransferase MoeA [Clostridium chauvoei]MBX7282436.1 molybdopterin molybdotransferase MoeA [Clostridium chauvoei]MBX7285677.1 molybdopterin molybdotransferase MoeA [Clostridium chauvoei]